MTLVFTYRQILHNTVRFFEGWHRCQEVFAGCHSHLQNNSHSIWFSIKQTYINPKTHYEHQCVLILTHTLLSLHEVRIRIFFLIFSSAPHNFRPYFHPPPCYDPSKANVLDNNAVLLSFNIIFGATIQFCPTLDWFLFILSNMALIPSRIVTW